MRVGDRLLRCASAGPSVALLLGILLFDQQTTQTISDNCAFLVRADRMRHQLVLEAGNGRYRLIDQCDSLRGESYEHTASVVWIAEALD